MAALSPGLYRITLFCSLGNENAGRFSRSRFDTAIDSLWQPSNAALELDGLTHNPNTTVSNARNCGRVEVRSAINIRVKPGSSVEKIDLIRDVIRAMGSAGAIVRNAALESVWSTGRAAAADSACTADLTRGSFAVTRQGNVSPARPPSSARPGAPVRAPASPPPAPVPVPVSERIASGGATVTDATDASERGTQQSLVSVGTVTDSFAAMGVPRWVAGIGIGVLVFGLGAGLLFVIAGASGMIAERARK